jgi:mRNA interferase RelE/StbE
MPWQVILDTRAERQLLDLPKRDRDAIRRALRDLALDPGAADIRKLLGRRDEWRLRVGRWRVIIEFDTQHGTMIALQVLPRDRAYRD